MIIVDSNVIIFSEGADAPERAIAAGKIKKAVEEGRIGMNVIIASEVFHRLQKLLGSTEAAIRVSRAVTAPEVDYLEFTSSTVTRAMGLARNFGMRINDALIAQQAIDLGASILTDNVKDFKKIGAVKVLPLRSSL